MSYNIESIIFYTSYITFTIFIIGIIYKWSRWASMPIHLRWELYPVPHEKKAEYGGSYLEEVDWAKKTREVTKIGELKEMLEEMLFIKRIYLMNKRLWFLSWFFHFGIYLILVWFLALFLSAIIMSLGVQIPSSNPWAYFLYYVTLITGGLGAIMTIIGGIGLLIRRLSDPVLRDYTTWPDYLNTVLVLITVATGLAAWIYDPAFDLARKFMLSLVTFSQPPPLPTITTVNIALIQLLLVYIPFSKITHFIGKYFTYHKILWDDEPNTGQLDGRVSELLKLPLRWSAPHIRSGETWEKNAAGL
ncbi:Nitrate reductase, gamma subunit [Pyrobaculum islandicum DSM 4184]|uniref:Nitrate reductase, gamma subunit n=1 Tax=Pyrobaculum islandicum (strain DSM 4184 / JCM 9189 / GEO3) TaxID=384616 RepID=A1RQX7_PYRIL|nr:respiratory nitrate reductase subunit gamma [Pyrobaculum islandicum]ABL87359.1 Nitrate reductase, gamma subunit [Pyrobaculum islandicum DSM 4184]